tara:strand:- start:1560 stop:2021 length:462 start_codon:yes stop_codon:yes gene_type:complete
MKIKNYDYKYLLILLLTVLIIGNGCGIFGGVKLYEGASGAHTHGKQQEGAASKKKEKGSNSPIGVGVPKSKAHKKWEQDVNWKEAKRTRRLLLEKRVRDKKAAKKREKEMKKKQAEIDKKKKKMEERQKKYEDKQKAKAEEMEDNRAAVGMDF